MELKITHRDKDIIFTVELRRRRTTTIQVHRDGTVRVLAPKLTPKRLIMRQVAARGDWILRKQEEFSAEPAPLPAPEFVDGEVFSYLGRKLELQMREGRPKVALEESRLILTLPADSDRERRRKLVQRWYRTESERIFEQRMSFCTERAGVIGIREATEWKSRVLKRSWGSCSAAGRINLNLELVSAPVECIDYVILHELCHLKEHNHSPRFYRLMDRVCPEWKVRRAELNRGYRTRLA